MKKILVVLLIVLVSGCTNPTGQVAKGPKIIRENGKIEVYFCPQDGCIERLVEFLGEAEQSIHCALFDIDLPEVKNELKREIDVKLVNEFKKQKQGFCVARFPYSFLFTFKEFCQKSSFSDRMKAYDIGQEFMNIKPGLYEGVEETLDFLIQQNDSLVLLTKGDYNLQNKKIQINKLNRWFKEICIVHDKLPETFKELAEGYKPKDIYSIGDTIDSEINPALKAGFKAIHIPQQIWRYDEGAEIIDPEKTLIFKSFKDIKTNYYLL